MELLSKKAVISFKITNAKYTIMDDLYNIHILNTGNQPAYIIFNSNVDGSGNSTDFVVLRDRFGNLVNFTPDYVTLMPNVSFELQETLRDFIPSGTITIISTDTTCDVVVVKRILRE